MTKFNNYNQQAAASPFEPVGAYVPAEVRRRLERSADTALVGRLALPPVVYEAPLPDVPTAEQNRGLELSQKLGNLAVDATVHVGNGTAGATLGILEAIGARDQIPPQAAYHAARPAAYALAA